MNIASIMQADLSRRSVFLRTDFNVPISNGHIEDESRILHALPSIKHILEHTQRLIIASHLGRPDGKYDNALSLAPVGIALADHLQKEVILIPDYHKQSPSLFFSQLQRNQIILLENLRFYPEEKHCDPKFNECLAQGIQIYVNEAFGVSHRLHASTVGIPKILGAQKCYAGLGCAKEVDVLSQLISCPAKPLTIIMGGSKVADKIGALLNLMQQSRCIIIGGAMAFPFLKAQGYATGAQVIDPQEIKLAQIILSNAQTMNVALHLPQDHMIAPSLEADAPIKHHPHHDIPADHYALDIGLQTIERYTSLLQHKGTIIWNGPMGLWERKPLARGSFAIAEALSKSSAYTIVGGGDSIACIHRSGYATSLDYLCSGGGAMLKFLESSSLPALRLLHTS